MGDLSAFLIKLYEDAKKFLSARFPSFVNFTPDLPATPPTMPDGVATHRRGDNLPAVTCYLVGKVFRGGPRGKVRYLVHINDEQPGINRLRFLDLRNHEQQGFTEVGPLDRAWFDYIGTIGLWLDNPGIAINPALINEWREFGLDKAIQNNLKIK